MSLKDIGKFSNIIKEFKGFTDISNDKAIKKFAKILDGFEDIDDVSKLFKVSNVSKEFAKATIETSKWGEAIKRAGDAVDGIDDITDGVKDLKNTVNGLSSSTKEVSGLGDAFKGLGESFKSFITSPAGILSAIAAVTALSVALEDALTVDYDESFTKLTESSSKISETKSNLESMNSEYETTKKRISELEALKSSGQLTLSGKAELDNLVKQNSELERKIKLEETLLKLENKEAIDDAKDSMSKKSHSVAQSIQAGDKTGERNFKGIVGKVTDRNAIEEDIKLIKEYEKRIPEFEKKIVNQQKKIQKIKDSGNDAGLNPAKIKLKTLKDELNFYETAIESLNSDIKSRSSKMQEELNILKIDPEGNKAQIKEIEKSLNSITSLTENATEKQAKALEKIWDNDSFAQAQQKLVNDLRSGKDISVKDITNQFPELTSACEEADISVETLREELMALASQDTGVTKLEDDFEQFQLKVVGAIQSIDSLNAAIAGSVSGKGLGLSIDEESGALEGELLDVISMYSQLDGYDPAVLFEKTANGVHLNVKALRELEAQQEALNKTEFLQTQQTLQTQLNTAIADQASALEKYGQASSEYESSSILVSSLEAQLETARQLASAYDGATSSYQKWLNAQSNGEEGDMFRNVSETMRERGKQLFEEGRYNTNEFRAIADYYSDTDLSTASVEELVSAYEAAKPKIDRFFTGTKEGVDNFVNDMKSISDSENLGWVKELEDGRLEFNIDDEDVANRLGISVEAVQSLIRAMNEYDDIVVGNKSGVQDFNTSIEEMQSKASEAKKRLEELSNTNLDLNFNFSSTDVADLESQIERAKSNLEQFKNEDGTINLELDGAQDAITILQTLIQQKQTVSQPAIMTVDTSGLDENVANSVKKLQDYQTALNELNTLQSLQSAGISIDTSKIDEAKEKVNSAFEEIQNASKNGSFSITPDVSIDTSSTESLNSAISSLKPEIFAKVTPVIGENGLATSNATVNYTKGSQEAPSNKTAKVNYEKGKQENPSKKETKVNYVKGSQENPTSPVTAKVNYDLGTVAKPSDVTVKVNYDTSGAPKSSSNNNGKKSEGKSPANGTAHSKGTVGNSGKWGLKKNENGSLINELGAEIIVRNGEWFILNNGYPTLTNLRSNDIIFNHAQSKSILEKGYVTGSHAKLAYSGGTAYSSGTWRPGNIGNGNLKNPTSYSSSSSTKSSSSDKASEKSEKASEKIIDFVEIAIKRLEEGIKRIKITAESAFKTFTKRNEALGQEMSAIVNKINLSQQAYNKYMSQANSVGLSESYASQIRNGSINIATITDEDLSKKISDYQEW